MQSSPVVALPQCIIDFLVVLVEAVLTYDGISKILLSLDVLFHSPEEALLIVCGNRILVQEVENIANGMVPTHSPQAVKGITQCPFEGPVIDVELLAKGDLNWLRADLVTFG